MASDIKIGLALGSGSARGLAHIGALRAIEEHGIEVDLIAGASIGALIGAVYAAGNLDALESSFRAFDWKKLVSLLDLTVPKSGLMDGKKVMDFVSAHLEIREIERLPRPFWAVATDILTAREIVLSTGDLIHAIRASIAVPGIFTPVYNDEHILVDGGLVNPVPVSVARAMGADFVIAIDLNHEAPYSRDKRPLSSLTQKTETAANPLMDSAATHRLDNDTSASVLQAMQRFKQVMSTLDHSTSTRLKKWLEMDTGLNIFEIILSSINIMAAKITESQMKVDPPDLIIQPPLGDVHFLAFDQSDKIIERGYQSTLRALSTIDSTVFQKHKRRPMVSRHKSNQPT
ncbi:patatin-like phospholipase family protein [Nitrosomonas sp. ANs5]|uniref:patatin-like phospholipase family protein n=1 Tax=Nitrosomonas sp. ANs5 TaxID=3423941 RepID=UPI003D343BC8